MNARAVRAALALLAAAIALVSCPLPTATDVPVAPVTPPEAPPPAPTLEVDAARGLVVYVSETGQRIDVASIEADGSTSACVEPFGLAPVPPDDGAPADATTAVALVVGRRADGSAGFWVIAADGTVSSARAADDARDAARHHGQPDRDGFLRGQFGWKYHVAGWASDGTRTLVAGYAIHEDGFRRGPWTVEPGTTIGVYWWVLRRPRDHRLFVTRAQVIGTLDPDRRWPPRGRWPVVPLRHPHWWRWLRGLRMLLAGMYDAYLVMVDDQGVSWDGTRELFVVTGTDQDDQRATATIDRFDGITITPDEPAGDHDLVVQAVAVPAASVRIQDAWPLGATVANLGGADLADATVAFRLSRDATLDAGDATIGEVTTGLIAAGVAVTVALPAPVSIGEPGTHWVFAVADPADTVAESREDNNALAAAVAVQYPRLVIDTYAPTTGPGTVNTFVSLFGASGDPTLDTSPNLWNDNEPPYTVDAPPVSIAEDNDGNPDFSGYSRIDYAGGLAPGVYYLRVRGPVSNAVGGPYAIRALLAPEATYATFITYNTTDAPYETDNTPTSGGVPTRPVTLVIGGSAALNRYLASGDVDWFVLTLP